MEKPKLRFLIWEESPDIRLRISDYVHGIQPSIQVIELNSLLQIMMEEPDCIWAIVIQMSRVSPSQREMIGRKVLLHGGTIFALYQNQLQMTEAQDMGAHFLIKRNMEHISFFMGQLRSFIHQFLSKTTSLSSLDMRKEIAKRQPVESLMFSKNKSPTNLSSIKIAFWLQLVHLPEC